MDPIAKHKNIVRSSDVVGVSVINKNKEDLGSVYEIVLDKISGQVKYVVLESGAFLGLGGKFFAIPWKSFNYHPQEEAFVVNLTKKELEEAPGFDKDNWPETSDVEWGAAIENYYSKIGRQ